MRDYSTQDVAFYSNDREVIGDFDLEDGDFRLTGDYESAQQDIENRARTQRTDWKFHRQLGADLEKFIGEINTSELGERIEESMERTLLNNNRFSSYDLEVRAVPIAIDIIELFVFLKTKRFGEVLLYQKEIDL